MAEQVKLNCTPRRGRRGAWMIDLIGSMSQVPGDGTPGRFVVFWRNRVVGADAFIESQAAGGLKRQLVQGIEGVEIGVLSDPDRPAPAELSISAYIDRRHDLSSGVGRPDGIEVPDPFGIGPRPQPPPAPNSLVAGLQI